MFGRKDTPEETNETPEQEVAVTPSPAAPRTVEPPRAAASPAQPMPGRRQEPPRVRRSGPSERVGMLDHEERKLTVGKGLSLSGEITACDVLVVEGKVEARLSDGKLLEITETGQFRGSVEIENADIAGRYDGDLTVHGRLTVRGTGRISGMVKYGELEVSAGGQIIGEMQVFGSAGASTAAPGFKSAAKFTAAQEESDEAGALFSRKTANG